MEPERKIEKLLRVYAKKRRAEAGDPLKLHPANRRILLGEAASRVPEASPRREPGAGSVLQLLLTVVPRRLVFIVCAIGILAIGVELLLPGPGSVKRKTQSTIAMNNLKQIGMATRQYAEDNKNVLPASLDEVTNELGTREVLIDPASRKPFVYAGGGKKLDDLQSNTLLAYSLADKKGHAVLFADGRVETVTGARFAELTNQKSGEFALAGQSVREQTLEIPLTAPPAASAPPALPPPVAEKTGIALAKDQSNAGDLGVNAPSAGEPASRQPELAESGTIKLEPGAAPAPTVATAGSFGGAGQTASVNGHISGILAATENSDAVARNRSFERLATQTNSVPPGLAAKLNFVQAGVSSVQNLFKNSVASAQATPVLQSFQLQQNGNVILIVDRDGSVYHGSVRSETETDQAETAVAETVAARVAPPQSRVKAAQSAGNEQQAAQNYFFRVAGMNRTLKQNVVFTGNFLANSGAPQAAQTSNYFGGTGGGGGRGVSGAYQFQQAAANQSQQSSLWNSRIVGTAVIASTNQIEINAVPATQ